MEEHDLTEVEIEKDGTKIKLRKGSGGKMVAEQMAGSQPVVIPMSASYEMASKAVGPAAENPADGGTKVRSPMVGTFYTTPAPDQPPYVTVGQSIKVGDVLCIIEAMKLMNEIKSESNGTIVEVLVNNGQPVEFDQPLFKIK